MALAHYNYHELSHQLRFSLFEIGLSFSQTQIEQVINQAHHHCLHFLQKTALNEQLISSPIITHHIYDFLEQLQQQMTTKPGSRFFRWSSLRQELDEKIANEALVIAYRQRWQYELSQQAQPYTNFWNWLKKTHTTRNMLSFLEQWSYQRQDACWELSSKPGFSRREVLQYSPEFQAQVSLHWCALKKTQAIINTPSYPVLFSNNFPDAYALWRKKLLFKHINPDDYYPLPVHPWQWRNRIQSLFSELIDSKQLVLLPHHQLTRPSLSWQTVMPCNTHEAYLKPSIDIHVAIPNQPLSCSKLLNKLYNFLSHQPYQQPRLYLPQMLTSIQVAHDNISEQKYLTCELQTNPAQGFNEQTYLVPLASLFTDSPLTGKPMLLDIIDDSNLSPSDYFKCYCECIIESQLYLLLAHSVSLRTCWQNTLIVFHQELPQAIMLKSIAGALHCDNLDTQQAICQQFIANNLQHNLALWITYLSRYYALAPQTLWRIVFDTLQQTMSKLAPTVSVTILNQQQAQLFIAPWPAPIMLTTHLITDNHVKPMNKAYNPLRQFM